MKRILNWRQSLACLPLLLGISATNAMAATAISPATTASGSSTTLTNLADAPRYLAQRSECREVTRNMFVYRRPDGSERVSSLRRGETIQLAEDRPDRDGWIAINDPTVGFVEARFLRRCGTGIGPSFPGNSVRPGVAQLCVNDRAGREGLRIYDSASFSSRVIDRAFEGERLRVNTETIRRDPSGFVWFPITFPTDGWVVYGLPNEGLINLENCELLELRRR